jgi:hypothetical protein
MRDLHADLRERAAACRSASSYVACAEHRRLFDIVAELWSALADDCALLSEKELAEEILEVSGIHADLMAATKPTLH